MKKKILSLFLCICVAFGCLFSFAGCSLIKDNNSSEGESIVLSVNGTNFDKDEIVNSFYSFIYQNYMLLYNGTDSSEIEKQFYNAFIKDQIVMEKAQSALEDETIKYCEKDAKDVWQSIEDYFRSQIDSYEQDLYYEEDDYPIWLQDEEDEDDEYFESYEDPSIKESKDKGAKAEKLSREDIAKKDGDGKSMLTLIYNAMFNYVSETEKDDDGEETRTYIEIKDQEGAENRRKAFALYMENIFLNAKAKGDYSTQDELMLDLVYDVYEAYYDAKIAELYQKYCEEVLLLSANELSEGSIVKLFLQSMSADKQTYLNEADYVSVITSDDTELILYHNNDKFFTVQHILLKFDDELVNLIKEDPFYVDMASKDVQLEFYEQFMQNREEIVSEYYGSLGALTDVNEKQIEKMPSITVDERFFGYYTYSEAEGYKSATAETASAKKMATVDNIINCYNYNFQSVMDAVDAVVAFDADINEQGEDIRYIIEAAQTIYDSYAGSGKSYTEIRPEIEEKVSSLVFIELSWIFSDDGLYNTIYKQLGYVMANYPDENNGFSHEFVDLSKIIYESVQNGTMDITDVSKEYNIVMTKDGVHIIKLDNVFNQGTSLIDISDIDTTDTDAVAKLMKQTYICNGSTQTVYDYYRDLVYSNLAGDDSTNGSYFENLRNSWLQEYLNGDDISFVNKLSYDELMNYIYS